MKSGKRVMKPEINHSAEDEVDMTDQVESEDMHHRKVQDIQEMAEKKTGKLDKNQEIGEKKKRSEGKMNEVEIKESRKKEISSDKKKEAKGSRQPKIFSFCGPGVGGGGLLGPSGHSSTTGPTKQGFKGGELPRGPGLSHLRRRKILLINLYYV